MSIDVIVPMTISVAASAPSRPGFGTPMLAAFHTAWGDRIREYSSPGAMLTDGFTVNSPAHKMATKLFSQDPHPPTFKIGRRALAFSQSLTLTPLNITEGFTYNIDCIDLEGATINVNYTVLNGDAISDIVTALFTDLDPVAATLLSANTETYALVDGMFLNIVIDGILHFVDFTIADFVDIANATAAEVASAIDDDVGDAVAVADTAAVRITSITLGGPRSNITVLSGTANAILGFSTTKVIGAGVEGLVPTDAGTHIAIATLATGVLFDFNFGFMDPANDLDVEDITADPGIATDLAAIEAVDPTGWYGFALDSNSAAEVLAAETWVQAEEKVGSFNNSDSEIVDIATVDDLFSNSQAAAYTHSHLLYSQRVLLSYSGVAILGVMLPTDPGTSTWALKTLVGVTVDPIKDAHEVIVRGKGGNTYSEVAGLNITYEGLSPGGEFLDTVRFLHFLKANLQIDIFAALAANPKIPYTNIGIAIITGVIGARLNANVETETTARGLARKPAPSVQAPREEDVLQADKVARLLQNVTFDGKLAGAIHSVSVTGRLAA